MPAIIEYKATKIYADGHVWTDRVEPEEFSIDDVFQGDPALVTVIITRKIRRDGGRDER